MNHKGQALKKTIEQTKTTKSDLIKRLGISVPTFYSWLNKKDLSDDKIDRVTKALGTGAAAKAVPMPGKKSAREGIIKYKSGKVGAAKGKGTTHKGQALKKAIEQTKTKKSDLIRRLGISVPTFYFWLNKKDLSDDRINKVRKALGSGAAGKGVAKKQAAKSVKASAGQLKSTGHKGQALKKAIEQTNTKKSDLIRRLGISVPTFYSWLNKKDLSDDKINRVKSALGSRTKRKAVPAARKQSKVLKGTGGNGVVAQINDLQRIIINLQQHLIDSLGGSSKSTASAPAKKRRRRRKRAAK